MRNHLTIRSVPGRLLAVLLLFLSATRPILAANSPGEEFFEKRIRPILADHCFKCHSHEAEKVKGGLLLDSREAILKGGESGPAIVPGEPDKSLLIKAVRYADENLQMPPKNKKLISSDIEELVEWVKIGAPVPAAKAAPIADSSRKAKEHWAFQPVKPPAPPPVKNKRWIRNPIDAFILARLETAGLAPSLPADKRTLIRRASFDLTGLPPTASEVDAFLADNSSGAFERVLDRLLDSPQYGERWARHWLDVARYADTKGYVFEEERRYPYSYTYRDYVIRAFNEDLPFDQFIVEQIAADMLPLGEDKRPLAALGFLTLGRRFLNNQSDIIDDRIDVVARGTMGLTVACARCHDHKFDPIPTKDYYSLYGVFASCNEPAEKPLLGVSPSGPAYQDYLAERKKRETELKSFREEKEKDARHQLRLKVGDYLLAVYDIQQQGDQAKSEGLARERKLDPATVQRWKSSLDKWVKEGNHPIFSPWIAFSAVKMTNFNDKVTEILTSIKTNSALNPLVSAEVTKEKPESMKDLAVRYGKLLGDIENEWIEAIKKSPETKALPEASREALRQVLYASDSPVQVEDGGFRRLFDVPTSQKLRALQRKVEELDATHAGSPPRAMAVQENSRPSNPRVFIRGNQFNPGPEVPRQFLEVLSGENRQAFTNGSGRLELARAIASPQNPLTARVMANRIWLQHFGSGLVRTPSDFGVRSDPPTHPELLDYLAWTFVQNGWSIKKLHKQMMLANVYQQASDEDPARARIDPQNQWYWRMNRQRLDFESMRDTLLAVSGKIDLRAGGKGDELTTEPAPRRRTVYGFVERQNLPAMFRTFDFASPDTTSPQRFSTTVPQQALFMVNSPFVVGLAKGFLARPEVAAAKDTPAKIAQLYQTAFQRPPSADEMQLALDFLAARPSYAPRPADPEIWQYGFGEYDLESKELKSFSKLPHFTGEAWQGGEKLPDDKLGWVTLNAAGGHVGNDLKHAAVRRWISPRDGTFDITGMLRHETDKGDGVRGRIVLNQKKELASWEVHNRKQEAKVSGLALQRGDTLDFVVDCRESVDSDSFQWSPVVRNTMTGSMAGAAAQWDAKQDFAGPKPVYLPLSQWEKFAQVILMSNELVFAD